MSRISFIIWFIGVLIIANMANFSRAQTFSAKVNIQADRLQPEEQAILAELPRLLDDYINNYNWTNDNTEILIESRISIVVETVNRQGSEAIYRAQFIINSPSGENFFDRSFDFRYQTGQLIEHQRSYFDPVLSMIDFYVYMVIAGELDSYILLGGTPYYGRARTVVDEGLISSYAQGWRNRLEELQLITDDDHRPLRETKFYYFEGLFYIEQRRDAEKSPLYAKKVVELLDAVYRKRPNSVALKRFLDGHYQEFCKLFSYDQDRENINAMVQIDNRHSEAYEACKTQSSPQRF